MKTFTKIFTLIFAFAMLNGFSLNAQHYADPDGNGGQPLLEVWVYGVTLPGAVVPAVGDEIAVYDGATLVGVHTLTVVPSTINWISSQLLAYSYNNSGDALFTPGNPLLFKYWSVSASAEYVAYGWGDGQQIDFHNDWFAPTSDIQATATTYGAYFPAVNASSYCYADLTFSTGTIPLDVTLNITVNDVAAAGIVGATVSAGAGYSATDNGGGSYTLDLFAGTVGIDYDYTVTISKTGYKIETFDITVNQAGSPYTPATVVLNGKGNLDGVVKALDITDMLQKVVKDAIVSTTIDDTLYSDYTDVNGAYLIEDIPDGTWTFTVTYPDYITQTFDETIAVDGTTAHAAAIALLPKQGTIEGEIFDATTIDLIDIVDVKLYELDGTWIKTVTTTDGTYSLTYYGGTYDIVVSSAGYDDFTVEEHVFYPGFTETMNFNLLPTGTVAHFTPAITGNANKMWSIHVEMAKFGINSTLPFDELIIFDTDQAGLAGEPGLRVGNIRLPYAGIYQNSGSNVLKAFAQFSNGNTGFVQGDSLEIWGYDISHDQVYETPVDWWFNPGVGTYSGTTFPDPDGNHISYLNIYWNSVPGLLNGTVTNESGGAAIPGITVEAFNVFTHSLISSDVTDAIGEYSVPLDEGSYDVRFSKSGWYTKEKDNVKIMQSQITVLDTTLVEQVQATVHYTLGSVWAPGFYFIGRCLVQDPVENDMLTLLDNPIGSFTPFSKGFFNSWVEDDGGLKLENTDPSPDSSTWIPLDYGWDLLEGYQVFRTAWYHFDMTGYVVKPEANPIAFSSAGIYYVPYFPYDVANPDEAITAFAGIFGELDWVMDSDGNRLHHDNGNWVDNIGVITVGEGFKVKMNAAATLTYPATAKKSADNRVMLDPVHFVYNGGNAAEWTYTIYINTDDFDVGDEIAAFCDGVMVGSMVIDSDDPWENDLNTFNVAVNGGYGINVPIELMAWDVSENIDYNVDFEMVQINNACYTGVNYPAGLDHFSYANVYRGTVSVDKNQIDNNVRVYPNPVNGTLNIESVSTINVVHVYNIHGALVSNASVNAKSHLIDVGNFTAGTYLVQLHTDTGVITKKVIVQ